MNLLMILRNFFVNQHSMAIMQHCNFSSLARKIQLSSLFCEKKIAVSALIDILFYRTALSELIIYFQHSTFVKLERNEVFSTFDLLAKIGGLFGLCTGASVITVVELIYYWSGRIICNVRLFGHWYGQKN
jgi:hypothetical protein